LTGRTRVLFSFRKPSRESNPYVHLLVGSLPERFEPVFFSWRAALFTRFDIFHVHWPETLLRGRSTGRRIAARTLTVLLLARLSLTRARVVRTVHNVTPHEEGTKLEGMILDRLDAATDAWIVMNEDDSVRKLGLPAERVWRIPHGHFRDWYTRADSESPTPRRGDLLLFGQIRPYKGIEPLLEVFRALSADVGLHLTIAGATSDPDLHRKIADAADGSPHISASLRFLSDDELVQKIVGSHMIVLPYSRMLNSGAALTALSLGRPVLVPRNAVNEALRNEVGSTWVHMYDPPLTREDIEGAIDRAPLSAILRSAPSLGGRDWDSIANAHTDVYLGLGR